jgi:hypothetical protein
LYITAVTGLTSRVKQQINYAVLLALVSFFTAYLSHVWRRRVIDRMAGKVLFRASFDGRDDNFYAYFNLLMILVCGVLSICAGVSVIPLADKPTVVSVLVVGAGIQNGMFAGRLQLRPQEIEFCERGVIVGVCFWPTKKISIVAGPSGYVLSLAGLGYFQIEFQCKDSSPLFPWLARCHDQRKL